MGLGSLRTLAEEVGIAAEIRHRREGDRVDSILDRDEASGRKRGDPMSERPDEIVERIGRQRSIDLAVSFG